jgi:polysaccharide export outer membrane protein
MKAASLAGTVLAMAWGLVAPLQLSAQVAAPPQATTASAVGIPSAAPSDYVIGPDDVLVVVFWRQKDLSAEVMVRPDGKVTLPLLNDVHAAGLTPDQLRQSLIEKARPFIEEPTATVVVKQVNSRKVFITGSVVKPGPYALTNSMTVLQLIAVAGGLQEFTKGKNIAIMRTENGRPVAYRFNYEDVRNRKNLRQNIELNPGDTIVVP